LGTVVFCNTFKGQVPLLKACPKLVEGEFREIAPGDPKIIDFELDGLYQKALDTSILLISVKTFSEYKNVRVISLKVIHY